ncbi:MAG: hypothetical protein ACRC1M_04465 [Methanobacteriaceae archaeon]
METSKIISESINLSSYSKVNAELKSLLSQLEYFSIEKLLSEDFERSNEILRKIANIMREEFHIYNLEDKFINEKIRNIASIISTITPYLINAIKSNDLKSLIIFLLVQRYEIKVDYLLKNEKILEKDCLPILNNLCRKFQNMGYDINVPDKSSYSDKKTMELLKDAFTNNDISQFYSELDSIERGCGIHQHSIENLLIFMKDCNFSFFLKNLSNMNNIFLIILTLQTLDENELFEVASNDFKNIWLNIELIRQILKKEKEKVNEESCCTIRKTLKNVYHEDYDFFKNGVKYFINKPPFNRSKLFNASLGGLLSSFHNSTIEEIFNECFEINEYEFHLESRTALLAMFRDTADEDKLKFFVCTVFERWDEFFKKLFESEEFFLFNLMRTDFANFIIYYYIMLTDEEIISQLYALFESIKYIDSEWFESSPKQITKLFLYYSKIFLLSYAYYNKEINNSKIRDFFSDFKKDEITLHRLNRHNGGFEKSFKDIGEKLGVN